MNPEIRAHFNNAPQYQFAGPIHPFTHITSSIPIPYQLTMSYDVVIKNKEGGTTKWREEQEFMTCDLTTEKISFPVDKNINISESYVTVPVSKEVIEEWEAIQKQRAEYFWRLSKRKRHRCNGRRKKNPYYGK